MKRNRVFRLLASLTVVVLCMTAFSVTAFAGGGDGDYYTGEPAETTPEPTEEPATGGMEPEGQPLTPEGNATLVDDYYGDKQLITVTTKAGNYCCACYRNSSRTLVIRKRQLWQPTEQEKTL